VPAATLTTSGRTIGSQRAAATDRFRGPQLTEILFALGLHRWWGECLLPVPSGGSKRKKSEATLSLPGKYRGLRPDWSRNREEPEDFRDKLAG